MKLGIMQPYFFPYLGYWQLINMVDQYVIYDDVQYIKGGWINRNRILCNHQAHLLTLPLENASPNKKINEIRITSRQDELKKIEKTLYYSYRKAPYFNAVFPMIQDILLFDDKNLARFLQHSITQILKYLSIQTDIVISSQLSARSLELHGEDQIIHLCHQLRADEYVNAIGGQHLYHQQTFLDKGISLSFSHLKPVTYHQFGSAFIANLSVIDVMMFNAPETIHHMLDAYELL